MVSSLKPEQQYKPEKKIPPTKMQTPAPHLLQTPPCISAPASRERKMRASPRSAPSAAILNTGEPEGAPV